MAGNASWRRAYANPFGLLDCVAEVLAIRTLLQLLIALVLAVTLAVAGYVAALSMRQEPVQAGAAANLTALQQLPDPKRLGRRPSFVPAAAQRDAFPPELRSLEVVVRELPQTLRAAAGVGVFDALDHEVAWLPLAEATERDGALVVRATAPAGRLRLVVASDFATSRNSYWTSVDWPADAATDAVPELRAAVQDVTVRCKRDDRSIASVLRLRRRGDDRWLPRTAYLAGESPDQDGALKLRLAAGEYELSPWVEGAFAPVVVTIPGPSEIEARFAQ